MIRLDELEIGELNTFVYLFDKREFSPLSKLYRHHLRRLEQKGLAVEVALGTFELSTEVLENYDGVEVYLTLHFAPRSFTTIKAHLGITVPITDKNLHQVKEMFG